MAERSRWTAAVVAAGVVIAGTGVAVAAFQLWPDSHSASSTTSWTYGDFQMQVPIGWTSQTFIPGGDYDKITFTNGAGDEYIDVSFNRCSACLTEQSGSSGVETGTVAIQKLVPADAQNIKIVTPTEITYTLSHPFTIGTGQQPVAEPGHEYEGLVIMDRQLQNRLGIEFSARSSDHDLVTQVINSVHQYLNP